MRTKGTRSITKQQYETVAAQLRGGTSQNKVAAANGISQSSVSHIALSTSWDDYQTTRAIRSGAARAAKIVKESQTKAAASVVSKDDALQAALDSIRSEDLALVLGQQRDILTGQKQIKGKLDELLSDSSDIKYDTARIRHNQGLRFWKRKK